MDMTKTLSPLALRIKELADDKGLSIAEIGILAGKSRNLVQNLMSGVSQSLGSDNLAAVARVLETTPEALLGIEEADNPDAERRAAAATAKALATNAEQIMELALQTMKSNDLNLQRTVIGAMKAAIKNANPPAEK